MRYMFVTGRGGLPGNDDPGGLSSCFVWSAIGLFPVTGQPIMLICSPVFDSVTIFLGERTFRVEAPNNSDENIYVQTARLNGEDIDRAYLSVDELVSGGVLTLTMGLNPASGPEAAGRHPSGLRSPIRTLLRKEKRWGEVEVRGLTGVQRRKLGAAPTADYALPGFNA